MGRSYVIYVLLLLPAAAQQKPGDHIGSERAIQRHLTEEDLTRHDVLEIIRHGKLLFKALRRNL
jgi:hypothetical protein